MFESLGFLEFENPIDGCGRGNKEKCWNWVD